MVDFREYKDIIREAVNKESKRDPNWKWTVKAVNKTEVKIGWGYLDYCGETDFFRVKADSAEGDDYITTTDPFSGRISGYLIGSEFYCDGSVGEILPKAVRTIANHAHYTW